MWVWLFGRGVRRGFLGGSRFWTVVGAVAALARLLKWVKREKVVYHEELLPGQSIIVANGREAVMMEG